MRCVFYLGKSVTTYKVLAYFVHLIPKAQLKNKNYLQGTESNKKIMTVILDIIWHINSYWRIAG